MTSVYDQKTATDMYGREQFTEGMQQGMVKILVRQFKDKKISAKEGAEYLNITVNEFLKLVN